MRKHGAECFTPANDGTEETIIQLLVEPQWESDYWPYIEARSTATLKSLDQFLRDIWVELCDHLSCFLKKKARVRMRTLIGDYFTQNNLRLDYEYDFGSTTELKIKSVGRRQGRLGKRSIELSARNNPPVFKCLKCRKQAVVLCQYCMDDDSFFCKEHAEEHGCASPDEYLPVVNSPRMGMCGYTGD